MNVAEAHALAEHTVFIKKRMFQRIGIVMEGVDFPVVLASTHPEIRIGDILYIVNGRRMGGAARAARIIRKKRYLSITVLR